MEFGEDLSLGELIVLLGVVAFIAWLGYEFYNEVSGQVAGASTDPNTGDSNGAINDIDAALTGSVPGGETSGTSETFTGAVATVISSPWQSIKSIIGIN